MHLYLGVSPIEHSETDFEINISSTGLLNTCFVIYCHKTFEMKKIQI